MLLHGFTKKTKRTSQRELERALLQEDYEEGVKMSKAGVKLPK